MEGPSEKPELFLAVKSGDTAAQDSQCEANV